MLWDFWGNRSNNSGVSHRTGLTLPPLPAMRTRLPGMETEANWNMPPVFVTFTFQNTQCERDRMWNVVFPYRPPHGESNGRGRGYCEVPQQA
jgi:hypothetical protein